MGVDIEVPNDKDLILHGEDTDQIVTADNSGEDIQTPEPENHEVIKEK